MNELVAIFFRLVNFGITIAAAIYLFKRYGLDFILEKINERNKKIEALDAHIKKNDDERIALEQLTERQKTVFEHMQKKLALWNAVFLAQRAAREEEKVVIKKKLEAKVATQMDFLEEHYVKRAIMPQAMQEAQDLLEKKYKAEAEGNQFLEHLIHRLNKSAQ